MSFNRSIGLGFMLMLGFALAPTTSARAFPPITYYFEGSGTGVLGGLDFTDAKILVTINADTGDIEFQPSLGAAGILGLGGTIDIGGVGIATFSNPLFIFGGNGIPEVGFGDFTNGNLITVDDASLSGYNLGVTFGPVSSVNNSLPQFSDASTNLGLLGFSSMSEIDFYSVVHGAAVPEPSTVLMLLSGLLCVAAFRARRSVGRGAVDPSTQPTA